MPIFGHFLAITQIFSGKFGLHFAGKLRGLFIIYGLVTVNQGHYAYLPISIVTTCAPKFWPTRWKFLANCYLDIMSLEISGMRTVKLKCYLSLHSSHLIISCI